MNILIKTVTQKRLQFGVSNDYMAMGQNETVSEAMCETIKNTATGAGGTRNISGSTVYHQELRRNNQNWMQKEFSSSFYIWLGSKLYNFINTCEKIPNCIIYSDAMNHNSIIEGIRRSRAEKEFLGIMMLSI